MAIDRTFEGALLKAVTCLEGKIIGLRIDISRRMTDDELLLRFLNRMMREYLQLQRLLEEIYLLEEIQKSHK